MAFDKGSGQSVAIVGSKVRRRVNLSDRRPNRANVVLPNASSIGNIVVGLLGCTIRHITVHSRS